jgi:RimJ/RimL family protein N-acetyltransferase
VLVGAIVFHPNRDGVLHVPGLVVVREHWSHGVGTALKRRAMAQAYNAGARWVTSQVHRRNYRMARVNQRLGINYVPETVYELYQDYTAVLAPIPGLDG